MANTKYYQWILKYFVYRYCSYTEESIDLSGGDRTVYHMILSLHALSVDGRFPWELLVEKLSRDIAVGLSQVVVSLPNGCAMSFTNRPVPCGL